VADRAPSRLSEPPPRAKSLEEALDHLQALEWHVAELKSAQERDRAAIIKLEKTIEDMKPKRANALALVGTVLSIAFAVGSVLFRAGTYPTREELGQMAERSNTRLEAIASEIRSLEKEQVRAHMAEEGLEKSWAEFREGLNRRMGEPTRRK
jgi:hypothetical protein